MKIVFFGTPDFAVASLEALVQAGFEIPAVVTAPDKPAGRGRTLQMSPVKRSALQHGIPVLQPEKLKDEAFLSSLRNLKADLFIVVAFRMLPEAVWKMPPKGTFNLHASLLPAYRGAAPINQAIMNGETKTGVSTFFLQHEIDTGAILFREEVEILPGDDAGSLHDKLMRLGSNLVVHTAKAIQNGNVQAREQDQFSKGPLPEAPKIFKEDCRLNWNLPAKKIHDTIRGLSPYPAAFTEFHFKDKPEVMVKLFRSSISDKKLAPGTILVERDEMWIGTSDVALQILELQVSGKNRMDCASFLRGLNSLPEKVI